MAKRLGHLNCHGLMLLYKKINVVFGLPKIVKKKKYMKYACLTKIISQKETSKESQRNVRIGTHGYMWSHEFEEKISSIR